MGERLPLQIWLLALIQYNPDVPNRVYLKPVYTAVADLSTPKENGAIPKDNPALSQPETPYVYATS